METIMRIGLWGYVLWRWQQGVTLLEHGVERLARFRDEVRLFCSMTWRHWSGQSAYRYTFRRGARPDGSLVQKNGWRLPPQSLPPADPSIREDLEAAWKAAGGD